MKRSKSSSRWLADHEDDEYVKRARAEGYRSRASYKLLEIDKKYQILRSGLNVIDLGAAPGGWSKVASKKVGSSGKVIALDLLEMPPIEDVSFIQGDFTEDRILEELLEVIQGGVVDLVISDMAPNLSGVKDIDQPRSIYLVELALDFAVRVLNQNGVLVVKCFEGDGIDDIREMFRASFKRVINFKPKASRGRSREIYILGRGFKG